MIRLRRVPRERGEADAALFDHVHVERRLVGFLPVACLLLACLALTHRSAFAQEPVSFLRGDVNADSTISISDALMLRRWLFNGQIPPPCLDAADFDDNGFIDLTDGIFLISFLYFQGATPPAPPFPDPGEDPGAEDDLDCSSYDPLAPASSDDILRVGDVAGAPGDTVSIPIFVTASQELEAFQLVFAYDPAVFRPNDVGQSRSPAVFEGTFYEGIDPGFIMISGELEPGIIVVGFVPSLTELGFEVPPGEETTILNVVGTISPGAPPGTEIDLTPIEEGVGPRELHNEVTHQGSARYVSLRPRTVGGRLQIVPDQTFFRRADSDGNGRINMSDAVQTFNYLFLSGPEPACLDAADTDDSGELDLTDGVMTLNFLFLGGVTIPLPYPEPGPDPTTADPLDCALPSA